MTQPKRFKPPNLTLSRDRGPVAAIQIEADVESPVLSLSDADDDDDELLRLDSDNSSPSNSPMAPMSHLSSSDDEGGDLNKDLAALEQLRRSVQKNLHTLTSPASSTASSYFTPVSDARSSPTISSASDSSSLPRSPSPKQPQNGPVDAESLYARLTSPTRPLLIDTRPLPAHLSFHIAHSIPIAIPSLILKRCRKPGGGFQSLDSLRQFITTEDGKRSWDHLIRPGGPWDGDIVVYDEEMDVKDRDNMTIPAWALLPVLAPLLSFGNADYLAGGIGSAGHHPDLETLIVSDAGRLTDEALGGRAGVGNGVFQLDTNQPFHPKSSLEVEITSASSTTSSSTHSNTPPPRSPLPMMSNIMPGAARISKTAHPDSALVNIMDATPSPPPSQATFRRPPPPQRRPSAPNLRRIDTKSAERLNTIPKLQVRTVPIKSATLSVPPLSLSLHGPPSPSHLNLTHSNHNTPPASANLWVTSPTSPADIYSAYFTPPHTPTAHNRFPSGSSSFIPSAPPTARPDDPPTTEEPFHWSVSTILPGFLFLGPELTTSEHVAELQSLGVRRILNIAAECEDELNLNQTFERYVKIPMRDTVEEDGIARGVREVCEILDDARLHSAPTYVHCKAGKSRSVTAVIAYLIHANHWTLSRAYQFVLERRKGISPNIGFVSELMTFEEEELGGKSNGVQPASATGESATNGESGHGGSYAVAAGGRRGGHVRESLPPEGLSAGGLERGFGDSAQEMEIRDATGRYRHARRAPVNENTLQPMRRVSKAGLESSAYHDAD
ncbi:hypothetical protein BDZ89DRAFT_1101817 [Hymenopellis radicata]|nr:hypothetical protein BDZ89DRAFT_1101817 [Hymenopellis radicata]